LSENLIQSQLEPASVAPPVSLYLLEGATVKLRSPFRLVRALRAIAQAMALSEMATSWIFFVASSLEELSWRPNLCCAFPDSFAVLPCWLGRWMSGQRPRMDGACTPRRRPREPWWATTSWGELIASMAWVATLCRQCGEVIGSVPQRRWSDI
jgi:hypothetical protein